MRTRPWITLVFGVSGLVLMGLGAALLLGFSAETSQFERGQLNAPALPQEPRPIAPQVYAPEPVDAAVASLLERSPFLRERSPFTRETEPAPPPAPRTPDIQWRPKLVGVLGSGAQRQALIIWAPRDQEPARFAIGDTTPWGTITALEASRVIIDGEDGEQVISLFD